MSLSPRVINVIAIVIVVVWAATFLLEFLFPSRFNPVPGLNEIVMIVAGYVFAVKGRSGHDHDDHEDSESEEHHG
jgi:hypothetical protein